MLVVTSVGPPINVDDINGACSRQVAKGYAASPCDESFGVSGGLVFGVRGGPWVPNSSGNASGWFAGRWAGGGKINYPSGGGEGGFEVLDFTVVK